MTVFNTSQFHYNKETKVFVADSSELGFPTDRIIGTILVQSRLTGILVKFIYKCVLLNKDNTLFGWSYKPEEQCLEYLPNLSGCEVHILYLK
jgi:hypothetical protein